jgi:1-acyl-sn-glycerol-3-phosphate acyltransferase
MASSFIDRALLAGRAAAVVAAAIPSTSLRPVPRSLALTRRCRREGLLRRMHFMVPWARFCRQQILGTDLLLEGEERIPGSTKGHMFVSNHQSYLDILVLMEALNTVAFLSKSLVRHIPLIGMAALAGGTVFFDRRAQESRQRALQQTLRMCRESTAVVVFPEGTRSFDGELRQKIYPGAIRAAFEERLKVIPVGLDGTSRVLPKSMDRVVPGQTVAVTIGDLLDPADYADAEGWIGGVWGRVTELFQASRGRLG